MQNSRRLFPFLILFLLTSCHMPTANNVQTVPTEAGQIWKLDSFQRPAYERPTEQIEQSFPPTSTPQLYQAVDFDSFFTRSAEVTEISGGIPTGNGNDEGRWLYFDPPEYSSSQANTLYAAFENIGDSIWTEDYYLEFFAGVNPCKNDRINLDTVVQPGEKGTFRIPINSSDPSWKACWQMKNGTSAAFYEFCYNHGSGQNNSYTNFSANDSGDPNVVDVAAGVPGKEGYFAFQKTNGSAPAKYSSDELSAELVSTSPASGHTFQAYDHFESLSVTFRNSGSTAWDPSYSLVFYSGYNWFHETAFPLSEAVSPGGTTTITMPMEIIEDNDRWVTCWYLSTPDGKNLSDFCFNYFTSG